VGKRSREGEEGEKVLSILFDTLIGYLAKKMIRNISHRRAEEKR